MTHPDDLDYCMYSLKNGNPYIPRQLDVTRADDLCMMLQFAGYPSLSEIRQHIEQTASQGRPTAFLFSGREAPAVPPSPKRSSITTFSSKGSPTASTW